MLGSEQAFGSEAEQHSGWKGPQPDLAELGWWAKELEGLTPELGLAQAFVLEKGPAMHRKLDLEPGRDPGTALVGELGPATFEQPEPE